jgi:HAD superfamily hydrolase (TIGR01509 family)
MALALLFDLDGTLVDTLDSIVHSMNAAGRELGVVPPFSADELRPMIGTPVQRQLRELRRIEGPLADHFTDRYYSYFTRRVDGGIPLYPGVRETFPALSGRPITTMSTRRRTEAEHMLRVTGLVSYFRTVVGGDQVSRPKPAPDLPRLGARSLGLPPNRCVVIGDSPVDIAAGRAAGMRAIAAMYGYGGAEILRGQGPDGAIAAFPELVGVLRTLEGTAPDFT